MEVGEGPSEGCQSTKAIAVSEKKNRDETLCRESYAPDLREPRDRQIRLVEEFLGFIAYIDRPVSPVHATSRIWSPRALLTIYNPIRRTSNPEDVEVLGPLLGSEGRQLTYCGCELRDGETREGAS